MTTVLFRRGEEGAILILVMLTLLILSTVVLQIFYVADVDKEITVFENSRFPIDKAAEGAFMKACSVLLQDLEGGGLDDTAGEGDGLGGDEGSGSGGGLPGEGGGVDPGGGLPGGDGMMGEDGAGMLTDSLVDCWARSGEITMAFSSDVEIRVLIRDEDAKLNILSILSTNDEFAEANRERLARLIDLYREGSRADVSFGKGKEIVASLEDWMRGDRDAQAFPTPFTKTGKGDPDPDKLEEKPLCFPLTMDELVMCPDITSEILYGYTEEDVRYPGLIEYITVYSNLILDTPEDDENEEKEEDPFASDDGGDEEEPPSDSGEGDESEDGEDIDAEQVETNNGLINVNTAPLPVLKALLGHSEISYSILDQVGEFREKAIEAYNESLEDDYGLGSDSQSGDDKEGDDKEGDEDNEDNEEESSEEDDEEEDFVFTDPDEVLGRVEEFFNTDFQIEDEARAEFGSLLTVTSNIFTIYATVKSMEGKVSQDYRAVVWRRGAETGGAGQSQQQQEEGGGDYTVNNPSSTEGGEIIIIVPFELYIHPIPYTKEELEELEKLDQDNYYNDDYYY